MFTSCVQTVFHQQPHTLEVSFAALQLHALSTMRQRSRLAILLVSVKSCAQFFKTFWTQIALVWRQWHACLTSNLSLSSVDIWRIILAQNQIINFVDFISNTRSAWAQWRRKEFKSVTPGFVPYPLPAPSFPSLPLPFLFLSSPVPSLPSPSGVQGRSPWSGARVKSPLKPKAFQLLDVEHKRQICLILTDICSKSRMGHSRPICDIFCR